eukprot:UN12497
MLEKCLKQCVMIKKSILQRTPSFCPYLQKTRFR